MTTRTFTPSWHAHTHTPELGLLDSEDAIKNEPMLFSADIPFAVKNGGPITRVFVSELIRMGITEAAIDSRVHMLKRGWWPCIPGWHIDDFHRGSDGQPDLEHADGYHLMMLVGDCSVTEFLREPVTLSNDRHDGEVLYGAYNRQIDALIEEGTLRPEPVPTSRIIQFGMDDLHQGSPATKSGWRFFIRASVGTGHPIVNEIRRQVQVYVNAGEGW